MGGVCNAGGNAKYILGGSGAGAYVMLGFLIVFPSLMIIGPGAAPGRMTGAGGGLWLSLTTKFPGGPAGMTTGANFSDFDGNWTISGPGAGPGAITKGAEAGTDRDAVTVGAGPLGGMGGRGARGGTGAGQGIPVRPGNNDGIRVNNFNSSGLIPGGTPGRGGTAQGGGSNDSGFGGGNRDSGGGNGGRTGGAQGKFPGNVHTGQAASTLEKKIYFILINNLLCCDDFTMSHNIHYYFLPWPSKPPLVRTKFEKYSFSPLMNEREHTM